MKYRKKPVVVDAVQWTGENQREMFDFLTDHKLMNDYMTASGKNFYVDHFKVPGGLVIRTLEGEHIANISDYIIRGVNGEFYPCKAEIFEKTYEKVEGKTMEQMTFKEAFEAMKHGAKVNLPGWNGYWCWDDEKQTIMIHCRPKDSDKGQGEVLDIRETQRVEYTFMHTQRDDWMIADENNCGVLGGQSTFGFGDAIRYLKRGLKVSRKGWNGKKQYIQLATGISYKTADGEIVNCEHDAIGNMAIAFVGTSGVQMGWLASQADMLAEDWMFAE